MSGKSSSKSQLLDLISAGWQDYQLLDSGHKRKLERFGDKHLIRFEPEAIWKPVLPDATWDQSDAIYSVDPSSSTGAWEIKSGKIEDWQIRYRDLIFSLSITESRQIGIFPEQQLNWDWISEKISGMQKPLRILNLFAYTGSTTLMASAAGAQVTHVDASKRAVLQAKHNIHLSGMEQQPNRFIVDDAVQFVIREKRRGKTYDGIIMDPPAFGRGPKGQAWKFEKSLPDLLSSLSQILVPHPALFLLTAYNISNAISEIKNWVGSRLNLSEEKLQCGHIIQQEYSAGRMINQAVYVRWSND